MHSFVRVRGRVHVGNGEEGERICARLEVEEMLRGNEGAGKEICSSLSLLLSVRILIKHLAQSFSRGKPGWQFRVFAGVLCPLQFTILYTYMHTYDCKHTYCS